jgi:hypothetical protein
MKQQPGFVIVIVPPKQKPEPKKATLQKPRLVWKRRSLRRVQMSQRP